MQTRTRAALSAMRGQAMPIVVEVSDGAGLSMACEACKTEKVDRKVLGGDSQAALNDWRGCRQAVGGIL